MANACELSERRNATFGMVLILPGRKPYWKAYNYFEVQRDN